MYSAIYYVLDKINENKDADCEEIKNYIYEAMRKYNIDFGNYCFIQTKVYEIKTN